MKCFIVFIGLLAICLATETDKKDEIKTKRQIHQGRLAQSQNPQSPRQYIIRAAGQSEQLQEFSPEYLNLLQELSAHQEQQQQESIQTIKKPQQINAGHRFQQYQIPAGSQYIYPQLKPQSEGQNYQEAEYLAQLNRKPVTESKKPQSLKITPSQGYNVQPTPAAVELQTHFSTADYENYQAELQQQLEQQQPINHQSNQYISQQAKSPLAESSLEKEIAKLIASNKVVEPFSGHKQQLQSYRAPTLKPKSQPKPEIYSQQKYQYLQPQTQQQQVHSTFTSPHPHPHRFAYIAPALQNYNPTEEVAQYHENPNKIQNTEFQYLQKAEYDQQQHQQHQQQQQQQPQHKIQYAPIEEKPQPQVTYDRSNVMKVIEPPQFDKPQQQQLQQQYLKPEQSIQQHQELYQKAIDSQTIDAPSHSSIYFSQSTGLQKQRPQQRKHEVNQQQKIQREKNQQSQSAQEPHHAHNHHHHHHHQQPQQQQQQHQQPQHQEQQRKVPSVRIPPPNNGEPITQEEFQALVDAGYSVQAIPIHVPVPVEEYQKHIEQQSKRKNSYQYQPLLQYQQQQPPQPQQQQDEQSENYSRPTEYGRPVKGAGKNKH